MYSFKIKVTKRDGSEEDFVPEKLIVSILKTGAPPEVARKITFVIIGKLLENNTEKISTKELMKETLILLKKEKEEWYNNWIIFDRAVKRRSSEKELS
ncbi:MAG TPA: ATP cone domain-containing protein [Geobacterales bacterium]|nr:ATP cone domain-containing protein [Geobacterales bacterium]